MIRIDVIRLWAPALLLLGGVIPDPTAAAAAPPPCLIRSCNAERFCPGKNAACRVASFADTEWRVCVYATRFGSATSQHSKGLAVGPAWVRQRPGPYRKVLESAGLAEILTAYHGGELRFYDTRSVLWDFWRPEVDAADAGPQGSLITLSEDSFPSVVGECRDRGPAWLCKGGLGSFGRRGQEMVLWGVFDAGNYDFITEYGFRDDGSVSLRLGATGYNHPKAPAEAHGHDALWRLDLDIDGKGRDTAYLTRHLEPVEPTGLEARDERLPFDGGTEGFADWNPLEFTTLLVEDAAANSLGERRGYELQPLRTGSMRHYAQLSGGQENWTQHDFWVTRWKPAEATSWAAAGPGPTFTWLNPDDYLLPFIADDQSVERQNLVVWALASAHHDPHSEDRDRQGDWAVTLTHWFGFELRPHDFFDFNPLGGPAICDLPPP